MLPVVLGVALTAGCRDEGIGLGGKENPKKYSTAVSLSPGATEILGSRMYGITIVGRTAQCNFPNPNMKSPVVMKGVKPNYEEIIRLKPSLVLYDDALFSEQDLAPIKEAGIETFAITGNTIDEFVVCLHRLGTLARGETQLSEYADLIFGASSVAAGAPPTPKPKVAIVMPGNGGEHMIAGTRSFVADVVRHAQGDPVGPDSNMFETASIESLVQLNPDVIVSAGLADSIRKDPRLATIKAVRESRILETDPDIALRRGSRVDKLINGLYKYFIGP